MSRHQKDHIDIAQSLKPGQITDSCFVCCSAPACCPLCSVVCPCCGDSEYILRQRAASTYIYLRENSLEWNEPTIMMQTGVCCGVDPCLFQVKDHVHVLYYDNDVFKNMTDQTRFCNECLTCLFGGSGERIRLNGPICCGVCIRGSCCCMYVPVCCPKACCPCMHRYDLYVEDAQKGLFEIKKARDAALSSDLHAWAAAAKNAEVDQL